MGRRKKSVTSSGGDALAALKAAIATKVAAIESSVGRLQALPTASAGGGAPRRAAAAAPKRRGPGRPKGSGRGPGRPKGSGRKPGRPKGSGRGPGRPPKSAAAPKRGRPAKKAATPKPAAPPKDYSALDAAIRAALAAAGSPVKAGDLAKQVVDNGFVTSSKAFHLEVGRRLAALSDVAKTDGGYALKG
ncbi:MAG: hypothetical protein JNL90_06175 [Planctomycetes bacterium]|nr:hypothetical protein [Planctomycetota bacterium]